MSGGPPAPPPGGGPPRRREPGGLLGLLLRPLQALLAAGITLAGGLVVGLLRALIPGLAGSGKADGSSLPDGPLPRGAGGEEPDDGPDPPPGKRP